jgi:hypothetical protein
MLALHCHTKFWPSNAWIDVRSLLGTEVEPFLMLCSSSSAVFTTEVHIKILEVPKRKKSRKFGSVEWLGQDTGPCLSSIAQCRLSQGNFWWELKWAKALSCVNHISPNIQQYSINNSGKVWSRNVSKQCHWVYVVKHMGPQNSPQKTSPNFNWELLLISGLNCTMWVMSLQTYFYGN